MVCKAHISLVIIMLLVNSSAVPCRFQVPLSTVNATTLPWEVSPSLTMMKGDL